MLLLVVATVVRSWALVIVLALTVVSSTSDPSHQSVPSATDAEGQPGPRLRHHASEGVARDASRGSGPTSRRADSRLALGRRHSRRAGAGLRCPGPATAHDAGGSAGAPERHRADVDSATHDDCLFISGAVLAFGAGRGWNGLFNLVVVQSHPETPAFAASVTQVISRAGSNGRPFVFGILTVRVPYSAGWILLAASAGGAGVVMLLAERLLDVVTSTAGPEALSEGGAAAEREAN